MPENPDPDKTDPHRMAGEENNKKTNRGEIDLEWDDDDVLPDVFSLDTDFVFRRMTEKTLTAAQSESGRRILDVGCGRGIDAVSLAGRGGVLFGSEPSRVMVRKAKDWVKKSGGEVHLVRNPAEKLPFRNNAFACVVCKGAIDHFGDPEQAVSEMCRVAGRKGKVVISVANYESLSCRLSRKLNGVFRKFFGREISPPHIWKIPPDHTFKFDYLSILTLSRRYLRIEKIQGISLLWGFPRWSVFLKIIPRKAALRLLEILDSIAIRRPQWGDVLVLTGKPLRPFPGRERSEAND